MLEGTDQMTDNVECPECGGVIPAGQPRSRCARCALLGALGPPDAPVQRFPLLPDYEIVDEISRGGMGIVFRARQKSLAREVAIKMMLAGPHATEEQLRRFRAEPIAAGGLHHPNIVAVHEVGVHEGQPFYAMDLVDGPSLARILRDGPLPGPRAARYLRIIAEAIHFAHSRGILHRDLKPANVLVDANDQPRITDFGLAKNLTADSGLTATGQVQGSPSYMPPEQASGERGKVSVASDVYSLGAMLYHMLTGRPPFVAQTPAATLRQVETADPLAPRLLNPSVPRDLDTISLKCLEKDPARRYATALELADELGRFLRDEPIVARPISRATRAWRWTRRNRTLSGLVVAITAAMLLTGWMLVNRHESAALQEQFHKQLQHKLDDLDTGLIQVINLTPAEMAAATGHRFVASPRDLRLKVGFYPETRQDYMITRLAGFLSELQTSMSREFETPIQIELYLYRKRVALEEALLNGLIDFVRVGEGPLVRLRRKNPHVTPLVEQTSGGKTSVIFTAASSPLTNLAGLKGKTIAAGSATATASGYKLIKTLLDAGLTASDVTIDYQGAAEGVPALVFEGKYLAGVGRLDRLLRSETNQFRILAQFTTTTMPWAARSGLDPAIQRAIVSVLCSLKEERLLNYLTDVPTGGFKPATAERFDAMDEDMRAVDVRFFGPGGNPATRNKPEND